MILRVTPRKTDMSPENQLLEDVFPIVNSPFLGDMLVFGGVRKNKKNIWKWMFPKIGVPQNGWFINL